MRRILVVLIGVVLLAGACGEGEPKEQIGQSGELPEVTTPEATTTTEGVTTTTVALAVVDIPEPGEADAGWDGTLKVDAEGTVDMDEFNAFLLEHAAGSDEVDDAMTPEEAISLFLALEPANADDQMLSGQAGGPEATRVVVVRNVTDDDSVRAIRYEFVVQLWDRAALEEAAEAAEKAAEGDDTETDEAATDDAEADSATEEEVDETEEDPKKELVPTVLSGKVSYQCVPGRGHQDFTPELCA